MTRSIPVAGIGNVFLGDDSFGVEMVESLVSTLLERGEGVERQCPCYYGECWS
jgi:Ni,Fe-hydrogenase maturation factor